MKELKQRIAQAANRQDRVTGAFWEGRCKITSVLDEAQLLVTLAYIDLNPFAADVCKTPEEGRYTSLAGRLGRDKPLAVKEVCPEYESRGKRENSIVSAGSKSTGATAGQLAMDRQHGKRVMDVRQPASAWLLPMDQEFSDPHHANKMSVGRKKMRQPQTILPCLTIRIYLKLVDYVARLMRNGKKRLAKEVKPILERLSLTGLEQYIQVV